MELIETKELPIGDKVYLLSKFPATVGREIITQYPISAAPKVGDYAVNEKLMHKVMSYVAVVTAERPNEPLRLSTEALINNHIKDATILMKIEWAMLEYNFDFFANGKASGFLQGLMAKLQPLITKTLMDLSQQSSQKNTQP